VKKNTNRILSEQILEHLFKINPTEENPTTESALAKKFRVSRTPVREALKDLASEGFIVRKKRKGIYIKPLAIDEIVAVYDLRAVLEGFAARVAAERAAEADIEYLMDLALRFTELRRGGDMEEAEEVDLAFHRKIIELSGNPFLVRIMENLGILDRAFKLMYPDPSYKNRNVRSFPHEKVVDALKKGDPGECEDSVRMHIQNSKQFIVEDAFGFKMNPYGKTAEM
jgi:DNA-binding GntR family transcriptional regulator